MFRSTPNRRPCFIRHSRQEIDLKPVKSAEQAETPKFSSLDDLAFALLTELAALVRRAKFRLLS